MANNSDKKLKNPTDLTAQVMSIAATFNHEQRKDLLHFVSRMQDLSGGFPEAKLLLERLNDMRLPRAIEYVQNNPPSAEAVVFMVELAKEGMRKDQERREADKRRAIATKAADHLHSMPNGHREKRESMKAAWASGKFSTRIKCAEEESDAIGMSLSSAIKALRNTPEPNPWPAKGLRN